MRFHPGHSVRVDKGLRRKKEDRAVVCVNEKQL